MCFSSTPSGDFRQDWETLESLHGMGYDVSHLREQMIAGVPAHEIDPTDYDFDRKSRPQYDTSDEEMEPGEWSTTPVQDTSIEEAPHIRTSPGGDDHEVESKPFPTLEEMTIREKDLPLLNPPKVERVEPAKVVPPKAVTPNRPERIVPEGPTPQAGGRGARQSARKNNTSLRRVFRVPPGAAPGVNFPRV